MTTGFFASWEALRNVDVAIGAVGRPGGDDRRTHVIDVSDIGVFLGLDVGKGEHHIRAPPRANHMPVTAPGAGTASVHEVRAAMACRQR
jgi:hypothetical protein